MRQITSIVLGYGELPKCTWTENALPVEVVAWFPRAVSVALPCLGTDYSRQLPRAVSRACTVHPGGRQKQVSQVAKSEIHFAKPSGGKWKRHCSHTHTPARLARLCTP